MNHINQDQVMKNPKDSHLKHIVRVSVIGCGHWGKNLVRNFYQLGALQSVCDTTDAGRTIAAATAPDTQIYANYTEALLDPEIQGVVIATPAETHFEIAKQAILAGKDVFVEKPLALSFEQGAELVRLADQYRRILMIGHVLEYHPAITVLRHLVEKGEIGKIHYIYSNRLSLGKVRREENILWSFAPHDIAIILRLLNSLPFEIVACGGAYIQPNIVDVTVTNLLFDNGVRAHIHVSWLHPFKEQRLVVIGSHKMISFDDVNKRLVLYDQRVEWKEGQPIPVRSDGIEVQYPSDEPLRLECQAFLEAIMTRQPPLTDGLSGLRVLYVLQAAQRSLMTNGQPVQLPVQISVSRTLY
ncbi:MAG: Gfo/Idh/MocA family oxidoreductase [Thermosphaera sp.]